MFFLIFHQFFSIFSLASSISPSKSYTNEDCYSILFISKNYFHFPCLKLFFLQLLSYGIVVASSIVKLPQIIKIIKVFKQNTGLQGLDRKTYFLSSIGFLNTFAYNVFKGFPLSTFMEAGIILVQDLVIYTLISISFYRYHKKSTFLTTYIFSILLFTFYAIFLFSGFLSQSNFEILQSLNIVLFSFSKLSQIYQIFQQQSAASVSLITWCLLTLGNIARISTTLSLAFDYINLFGYLLSTVLNLTIVSQIIYYEFFFKKKPIQEKEKNQ